MPKMLFCGFGNFKNKAGDKDLFLLKFLTPVKVNSERQSADSEIVPVFTTKDKYEKFLHDHEPMDLVDVACEVSGTKVFYSI